MGLYNLSKEETRATRPDELVEAYLNNYTLKENEYKLHNGIKIYRLSTDSSYSAEFLYGTCTMSLHFDKGIYNKIPNIIVTINQKKCMSVFQDKVLMKDENFQDIEIPLHTFNEVDLFSYETIGLMKPINYDMLVKLKDDLIGILDAKQ